MKKKILEFIGVFFAYLVLATIAYRVILLTPGTIGHNWDWPIGASSLHSRYMFENALYVWQTGNLASYPLFQTLTIFNKLFYLPVNFGINGEWLGKMILLATSTLAGVFSFYLIKNLIGGNLLDKKEKLFSSFFGGVFYAFSPFLFNDLIGGSITHIITYPFIPLVFLFFEKAIKSNRKNIFIIFSAVGLSIITLAIQYLVFITVLFFIYIIFHEKRKRALKVILKIFLVWFFLNFYWLGSLIHTILAGAGVTAGSFVASDDNLRNGVPSLLTALSGRGYFRDFFTYSIPIFLKPFWYLSVYGFLGLALWIVLIKKVNKKSIFWVFILLFSLVFATGGKPPFGNFVLWLYHYLPLMGMFRSVQHFIVMPTLALSLILGLSIYHIITEEKLPVSQTVRKIIILGILFIWLIPSFIYGDIGSKLLKSKFYGGNFIDQYQLSPGYKEMFSFLEKDKSLFRILFLPMAYSPYFLKTEYQDKAQGGDPLFSSPWPIVSSTTNNVLTQKLESNIYNAKNPQEVKTIMNLFGIKYVVLRGDVVPIFEKESQNWDYLKTSKYLENYKFLRLISSLDYVSLYEVTNE